MIIVEGLTFSVLDSIQNCSNCVPFYTRMSRIQNPKHCYLGFLCQWPFDQDLLGGLFVPHALPF